ncbi:hypothetical protein E4M02_11180 [Brevundimonas sp. S30B]|uniref:DUF6950 family protein n=1 Tax=unclassified Brevundimonas TaxID=2622653 RepID=UPI001071BC59|nr:MULTISPECIES: hypothetical protein [unclassified Brevundimonas]QBX38677.1 hypothetical protein E4M01_13440 [Brevundimonas sp. MF30-B]TFW01268.1 hypothetical protein E4M02_11180 [Brevundimonas sp. S30B]
MRPELVRRVAAAQACIDRFAGKPYDCAKSRDCIRLAGHALHKLGKRVSLTKGLRYSSEAGGVRAMRKLGFSNLLEAVDAALGEENRIAPAAALPGDIIALPTEGDNPFGCALAVAVGNGRVIGFQNGHGVVVQPLQYLAAWRSI